MNITTYELSKADNLFLKNNLKGSVLRTNQNALIKLIKPDLWSEGLIVHSGSRIGLDVLKNLPNLKFILTRTAGVDHIDEKACQKLGIKLLHLPGQNARSVAEFAMGLILTTSRQIFASAAALKKQLKFPKAVYYGHELQGKTLGVVGTGAIGKNLITIAKLGFGMNVIAFDVMQDKQAEKDLGFEYVTLPDLQSQADIISLHAPLTKQTAGMVNDAFINACKNGLILINTARGGLVKSSAILKALQSKKMIGYGTDVFGEECGLRGQKITAAQKAQLALDKKLIRHPLVVATPHMAHATVDSNDRINQQTVSLILDIIKS